MPDTGAERMRGQEGAAPVQGLIGGRYQRIAALGRGGMGEIWHVRDLQNGQEYALKALHDGLPQMREMFVRGIPSPTTSAPSAYRATGRAWARSCASVLFYDGAVARQNIQTFLDR